MLLKILIIKGSKHYKINVCAHSTHKATSNIKQWYRYRYSQQQHLMQTQHSNITHNNITVSATAAKALEQQHLEHPQQSHFQLGCP